MAKAVMVPLGVGMLLLDMHRWRFTRTDLWVALYIVSAAISEHRVAGLSAVIIAVFTQVSSALFPYMAGKLLIEPYGARVVTARRFVTILFWVSLLSMTEYFAKQNPFRSFWSKVFPDQNPGWTTQLRWGFGRVAGPYAQAELAGMILLIGVMLTLWLGRWGYLEPRFRGLRSVWHSKYRVMVGGLLLCLFMTQARGPWIGTILASALAAVGRARNMARAATILVLLALLVGVPGYLAAKKYLDAPTASDEQQTAQYRAELLANYVPIARMGGIWGWGQDFPKVYMQPSIDNQYLFAWITQGYFGGLLFVMMLVDPAISAFRSGRRAKTRGDRHFAFTLLGIVAGLAITLGTVFLGEQTYAIFFILIGWCEALASPRVNLPARQPAAMVQIYS
jgi:hypothetical protein